MTKTLFLPRRTRLYIAKRKRIDLFVNVSTCLISFFPLSFLLYLFFTIFNNTYLALNQTVVLVENINYSRTFFLKDREEILFAITDNLKPIVPDITIEDVIGIFSNTATHDFYAAYINKNDSVWLLASSVFDALFKKHEMLCSDDSSKKCLILQSLIKEKKIKRVFNKNLFLNADSRDSAIAGVFGVIIGSFFTILVCIIASIPIGVMSAFCIEELVPKNKWTNRMISFFNISINNLASTPAIIYGILGLLLFVNFLHLPRSSSLVGGLTLSFIMLPTIIITTRQAILSVPRSIKEAAIAMGASKMQVIMHHTLPLSMPLIITGAILGIARVIGESAPLLVIGMVAFVADSPENIFEPATVFPIQIFLWASSPDTALIEKTSVVIMLLFIILFILNKLASFVRRVYSVKFN